MTRLDFNKALIAAPKLAVRRLYWAAGAAAGTAEGLAGVARLELASAAHSLDESARRAEEQCRDRCAARATQLYVLAGACVGLYLGSSHAARALWMQLVEDEVRLRLEKGSPIKYRPPSTLLGPTMSAVSSVSDLQL